LKLLKLFKSKFFFLLFIFILIGYFSFLNRNHLYNFHYYHLIKNIVTNDHSLKKFYAQFPEGKIQNENKELNLNFDNLNLKWFFRPSYTSPVYPYVLLNDVNKDGIKEVYYASNTEFLYELDSNNGEILRKYKIPFGIFSVKGNLLYEHNNETFFLGTTGQSLPVTVLSLNLSENKIKKNWKKFIHGQFVEASINKIILDSNKFFLISTRDSTFSRGSNNLIDFNGDIKFISDDIVDICDLRPSIANDNAYIIGSHNYITHELSNSIIKKSLFNGDTLWKKKFNHDTGFFTPIIHNKNNENYWIFINDLKNNTVILNGKSGEIVNTLNNVNIEAITSNYIISNYFDENGSHVEFINIDNFKSKFTINHSIIESETITEKFFIFENQNEIEYHGFSFNREEDIIYYKKYLNDLLIQDTQIPLNFLNFNKEKYEYSTRNIMGISKIGDVNNDGKLEIFIKVYDHLLLFESDLTNEVNFDFDLHPLLTQDAYIF